MQGSSLSLQKKLFRLSGETCGRRWAWCLAVPGMHSMVWRAVTAGSLLECCMAAPLRATSLLSFPLLVFLPEQRKAREARQTMSVFWGEGEFEGEGPFYRRKKGPSPSRRSARQITDTKKTGPSREETAPFRIVGAVVDAGKRGTGAAGTAPNAAFVAAPRPMVLCFERRKSRGTRLSKSVWEEGV